MAGTTGSDQRIVELLQVEESARDPDWLEKSLQTAVELELSTLPVYLSGLWSIKVASGDAFDLVKSVIMEEMLHMGLVCNMLKAIGGSPKMRVPSYPGHLPGGVRPELTVFLAGLSPESVKMYMGIEEPEHPLALAEEETFPTIGAFYDAIFEAFQTQQPTLSPDGQLSADISVPNPGGGDPLSESVGPLTSLSDVETAITKIKDQGEGTSQSPDFDGELAHFYRFGEILHGKRLIPVDGKFKFEGPGVPFPDCFPVAKVPPEGYPESHAFDVKFTAVVNGLEQAWANGSQDELDTAIGAMFALAGPAKQLVQKPLPSGGGNFGPDFKLVTP